jgi:hypothetical protein
MLTTKVDKELMFHTRYVATECILSVALNCLHFDNAVNLIMQAVYSSDI